MPREPDEVPGSVEVKLQSLGHKEDGPRLEALVYGQNPMSKPCQMILIVSLYLFLYFRDATR